MQTSVTLAQVPYTGFDYGQMYNSLYWVGLLVWSLIVALIIVKNKDKFAKMFAGLAKVFIVEKRQRRLTEAEHREPQIITERVVKFDPLVDPHTLAQDVRVDPILVKDKESGVKSHEGGLSIQNSKFMTHDSEQDSLAKHHITESDDVIRKKVQKLVNKELAISRVGQTKDEFSGDDFGTVDFDGVNPDDSWVQRGQTMHTPTPIISQGLREDTKEQLPQVTESQKKYDISKHITTHAREVAPDIVAPVAESKDERIFTDSIDLDTSEEYPRIVLTREEVSNY